MAIEKRKPHVILKRKSFGRWENALLKLGVRHFTFKFDFSSCMSIWRLGRNAWGRVKNAPWVQNLPKRLSEKEDQRCSQYKENKVHNVFAFTWGNDLPDLSTIRPVVLIHGTVFYQRGVFCIKLEKKNPSKEN